MIMKALLLILLLLVGSARAVEEKAHGGNDASLRGASAHDNDKRNLEQFDPRNIKVLVEYKNEQGKQEAKQKANSIKYESKNFNVVAMEVDAEKMLALENDPNIVSVSLDSKRSIIFPIELQDDASTQGGGKPGAPPKKKKKEPNSKNRSRRLDEEIVPWGVRATQAGQAMMVGDDADQIKICVIDTGYDINHVDLPPLGTVDGTDNDEYEDSNGQWNFDSYGHGTHCAGTIGALGNNTEGVVGVIPDMNPNGITLHIGKGLANDGYGTDAGVLAAVDDCVEAGAKVISMSLGGVGSSTTEENIFNSLLNTDILVVAAASNDGDSSYSYPASYGSVMSVAAVADIKEGSLLYARPSFSNFNDQVEISGPGVDVESTLPGNSYSSWSGTSMATPHVSGVAALVWSYDATCTAKQIRRILLASALPLAEGGCDVGYGRGMVQAQAAIDLVTSPAGCAAADGIGILDDSDGFNLGNVCDNAPYFERCVYGQQVLTLALAFDGNPEESMWLVRNEANGRVLETGGPYDGSTPYVVEQIPLCIGRRYSLTMTDSGGDGLTTGGGYLLNLQGDYPSTERAYGTMSGSSETTDIVPLGCPSEQEVILIEILTDDYPQETSWELVNGDTGDQILSASYSEDDEETYFHYTACVERGASYDFILYDTYGDGLCCGWGLGSYSIMTGASEIVRENAGVFLYNETTMILVPALVPSMMPSGAPSLEPSASPSKMPVVNGCSTDDDCPWAVFPLVCPAFSCNLGTNTCEETCNCDYVCDQGESASTCPSGCTPNTELTTVTTSNNQQAGNMFKVAVQKSNLHLLGFEIHATNAGAPVEAHVYHKPGDFVGFENNPGAWNLLQTATVTSQGIGTLTPLPPLGTNSIILPGGTTHSFYVTLTSPNIRYTNGNTVGESYTENNDLVFFQGYGKSFPFGSTFQPRIWNGKIIYDRV